MKEVEWQISLTDEESQAGHRGGTRSAWVFLCSLQLNLNLLRRHSKEWSYTGNQEEIATLRQGNVIRSKSSSKKFVSIELE